MRGKISDQDLSDYAMNELQPEERLYIESILAVSEECRHDVYQMIEISQLLEEGFEAEDEKAHARLTGDQRESVLRVRYNPAPWYKIAAVLVAAASVAFTVTRTEFQQMGAPARKMAVVSKHAAQVVAEAVVSPENVEFKNPLESLRALAGDSATPAVEALKWLQTEVMPPLPMVCTPPTLFETAQLGGREVNQ
jgi:anti-sigma factor RsiW